MKKLTTYILSLIIISLINFFVLSKSSTALTVPTVPNAPNIPQTQSVPTVPETPDKPHPPTAPTTPPLPTGKAPTATTQPGVSPTTQPTSVVEGPTATPESGVGSPAETAGEGATTPTPAVLGISAASGDLTFELILMTIGLVIASFGVRNVLAKKI